MLNNRKRLASFLLAAGVLTASPAAPVLAANPMQQCMAIAENYAKYFGVPGDPQYESAYDDAYAPCIENAHGGGTGGSGSGPPGSTPILPPQQCVTGTHICSK
jgi:hypothetical protein